MTTIREKYLEKIKEDFEVLSTIVLQQMELVITATHDNKDGELYTKIEHNEVIIDGLEIKSGMKSSTPSYFTVPEPVIAERSCPIMI